MARPAWGQAPILVFSAGQALEREREQVVGVAAQALRRDAGLAFEHEVVGALERAQPALGHQPLVDAAQAAGEGRVHGRAQHHRLAVHRAAGAHDQVGAREQAVAVDGVLGHDHRGQAQGADAVALVGGAGEHHGDHVVAMADPVEHGVEQRVREPVIERDVRGRPQDDADAAAVKAERSRHRGVGLEPGQVVLLLQPRVAHEPRRAHAEAAQPPPAGWHPARAPARRGGS